MVAVIKASKWKLSKVGFHCRLLKKRVWWIQELSVWGSRDFTPVHFSFVQFLQSSSWLSFMLFDDSRFPVACIFTLILKYNLPSNGKWYHYCSVTYRLLESDFPLHVYWLTCALEIQNADIDTELVYSLNSQQCPVVCTFTSLPLVLRDAFWIVQWFFRAHHFPSRHS